MLAKDDQFFPEKLLAVGNNCGWQNFALGMLCEFSTGTMIIDFSKKLPRVERHSDEILRQTESIGH